MIGSINFHDFECFFSRSHIVPFSFAQAGSLGRWLDRRAGSPGVITSYFFVWYSVAFSHAWAAQASVLAGPSDKARSRSEEEGSSFTIVVVTIAQHLR